MIQCKLHIMFCLVGLLMLSCEGDPIWNQVTIGEPPKDGTWEGPSVGNYPDRKTKMFVEGGGAKVTYFAIYPGLSSWSIGSSGGSGYKIENNAFEIVYSEPESPSMYGFYGKVTGKFKSSGFVEGEYDLEFYYSHKQGRWTAQWQSPSLEY